jgi:hypothetical protein
MGNHRDEPRRVLIEGLERDLFDVSPEHVTRAVLEHGALRPGLKLLYFVVRLLREATELIGGTIARARLGALRQVRAEQRAQQTRYEHS